MDYKLDKYTVHFGCISERAAYKYHLVTNNETGEVKKIKCVDIYCMYKDSGVVVPPEHFNLHAEFVRKRDNPTEEEIAAEQKRQQAQKEHWENVAKNARLY